MSTKIQPRSTLKVVFSGEPAVDDGGPRRELFSGKLLQCSFLLIVMGIWHSVKSMYVVGVLLTSIEDEMYSFRSYIVIRGFCLLNLFIKVLQCINITMQFSLNLTFLLFNIYGDLVIMVNFI